MAGGGRWGVFSGRSPEKVADLIRKSEAKTASAEFTSNLAGNLGGLLAAFNGRDHELVRHRLDELRGLLENAIEDRVDLQFGGSVAKRTYVDGLSDIDSLLIINDTMLELKTPEGALDRIADILNGKVEKDVEVRHGDMAVSVQYPDGMKIQLLPAIRTDQGMRIPSSRRDAWSEIEPQGFRQALSKRNEECGGKLVPTIKLAKAIIGKLPGTQQLSGYHVESLAIAAFRGYNGEKTTTAMLPTFFELAKDLVLQPIRDKTGQSIHVDEYLGGQNSEARANASHILERIAKRMRNANAAASIPQWQDLFGIEE